MMSKAEKIHTIVDIIKDYGFEMREETIDQIFKKVISEELEIVEKSQT